MTHLNPLRRDSVEPGIATPGDRSNNFLHRSFARIGDAGAAHPILPAAVVIILVAVALTGIPLCADVSWQLWIAHHIRMGARLYVDIIEVNPPVWYWMAMPIDVVAGWTGITPGLVLIAVLALVTIASLAATERLIRTIPAGRRAALLVYAALAMLVVPAWMTGQREQLLLIASLPYVALVAARRDGRTVSPWLAAGIGIAAALGFALKHYFLIAPMFLELWLLVTLRRGWRPIRWETAAVALVGTIYVAAILAVTPDYLTAMLPMLRLAYGATGDTGSLGLLQPTQYVWIATLLVFLIYHRSIGRSTPLTVALLIASAGFAAAWAIQHKGWPYQAVTTSSSLAIALAAFIAEGRRRLTPLAPALLAIPVLLGWRGDAYVDAYYRKALAPLAAETRPGDTVGIVSTSPGLSWPLTSERHLRSPTRYYGYWMLAAVMRNERYGHDPRLAALGRKAVTDTVTDYRCAPPSRILFTHWKAPGAFDIYDFFMREPSFRALMTHYRRERWDEGMDIFRRVSPLQPIAASACRRGV